MRWALIAAALIIGGFWLHTDSLEKSLAEEQARVSDRDERIGELTAANAALVAALAQTRAEAARKDAITATTTREKDALTAKARSLSHQLTEALRHARITADTVLPDDVVLPLCLRYHAARGEYPQGDAANGADAGAADSRPAQCSSWRGMTVGNALEWTGALLDHAGAERLDKVGLREWAKGYGQ